MVSASNFVSVDKKYLSSSINGFLSRVVTIPLAEEDNAVTELLVSENSVVKEGEIIAKTRGAFIHSSVPGYVTKLTQIQYANGKQGPGAIITMEGSFSFLGKKNIRQNWLSYESTTLLFLLREAGVINTFSKTIPAYTQIKKIKTARSSIVVLRLFDLDPSYITESFVSRKYLAQVVEGAAILAKVFGAVNVVIAYSASDSESLKDELDQLLSPENKVRFFPEGTEVFTVGVDTRKYPAGTMHDLTVAVKKTYKSELFSKLGCKDLFIDSITALNTYNAVVLGIPHVSSFVHVTGDCLNSAGILNLRVGTPLKDVVEMCGGFKRKLSKIVINGIVSGLTVSDLNIPVSREMKSVEFIPVHKASIQLSAKCIRCGNCRKICPVHLWPGNLYRIAHLQNLETACESDKTAFKTSVLCMECNLCNTVCPARLPLSQTISILKDTYHE